MTYFVITDSDDEVGFCVRPLTESEFAALVVRGHAEVATV